MRVLIIWVHLWLGALQRSQRTILQVKLEYLNKKTGSLLFFSRWGHRQSHRFLTFATAPVFTAGLIFLEVPFWRKSFGLLPSLQRLSWQFFFAAGIIQKKQRLNKIWTLNKSELGSKQSLNDIILLNLSKSLSPGRSPENMLSIGHCVALSLTGPSHFKHL